MFTLTRREHAKVLTPSRMLSGEKRLKLLMSQITGPRQPLNTGVSILQLQLINRALPFFTRHIITARHQARRTAQHHFISLHATDDALADVQRFHLKLLLTLLMVTLVPSMPLPE